MARSQEISKAENIESIPSLPTSANRSREAPSNSSIYPRPEAVPSEEEQIDRKRKRLQEPESLQVRDEPPEKRARTSPSDCAIRGKETASSTHNISDYSTNHWIQEGSWPKELFEHESGTRIDLERDCLVGEFQHDWLENQSGKAKNMAHPLLARKKSTASLRRQNFEAETTSDVPREEKAASYRTANYEALLATKGSFMRESDLEITDENKIFCQTLLDSPQTVVENSLFRDDRFKKACGKIHNRNEARVIQDISRLIVPSAESLATCGAKHLDHLIESVNEGWNSAIPVTNPRPQPDFSVGFSRSAFTNDQLKKLEPFIGDLLHGSTYTSYFMATWMMYFPFFTCEVKCGASALDVADRQNAHSMTHAVRAVVELFRFVHREDELHRKILAFSISHDDTVVKIYGHYALIEGKETSFYRHPIHEFSFMASGGKEKWTAYKFTKNVYDKFMPDHLAKIRSAIDAIPATLNFEVDSSTSIASTDESALPSSSQEMGERGALSQDGSERFKKPRLKPTVILQQEIDWLKQQLDREREESKQRHAELMEQNKRLMDMFKR